ncbi:hypothetical protein AB5I41_12480 [Sphingomonas sp. MMS24-JH45]
MRTIPGVVGIGGASRCRIGAAGTPAAGRPGTGSAQGDVSVTIYNNDVALVQDVRPLDLAGGRVRQSFPDVGAQIRPETVSLEVPDATIVEQNFDYDLLSPSSLMEKAVGETITLVRTNPATGAETRERARVLAVNGGVVLDIGGRIEVLRDDGLPVRAVFDRVPESLRARPTLSVTLADPRRLASGTAVVCRRGLGWSAITSRCSTTRRGRSTCRAAVALATPAARPSPTRRRCWSPGTSAAQTARAGRPRPQRPTRVRPAPRRRTASNSADFPIRWRNARRSRTSRPSR